MRERETALMRRVAAGDRAAFNEVVTEHQAVVWRYLLSNTLDAQIAEDALQETFLTAWNSAHTFRADASVRSWLLAVARNKSARTWRRKVGEPTAALPIHELGVMAGWGTGSDPEQLMSRLEDQERVHHALQRLDPSHREVIVLRDLQGLTGAEAAHVLGISTSNLKSRLHRARLHLLAQLRQESEHDHTS